MAPPQRLPRRADAMRQADRRALRDVIVPLDRTGVVPGTVSLHVEELPAQGAPRGVVFLIAGGPGQGSAHVYGLGDAAPSSLYRYLFPGYTLVAYDDRGTGDSGLLDCPALQRAIDRRHRAGRRRGLRDADRAAARLLQHRRPRRGSRGRPRRHSASTRSRSSASRTARSSRWPTRSRTPITSSGCCSTRCCRPRQPDPYEANVLRALPATLSAFCSDGGCRPPPATSPATSSPSRTSSERSRFAARCARRTDETRTVTIGGVDLLSIILGADLSPGLAAELPAVVKAARAATPSRCSPRRPAERQRGSSRRSSSATALYAATVCHDGPFPWAPDTPIAARPALEQAAIAALPPGSLGPVRDVGGPRSVTPISASAGRARRAAAPLGAGPLPNVPMLAVSGGFDMRTPTAGATSVVARFPQGKLLVVPGIGHSTVDRRLLRPAPRARSTPG